MKKIVLVPVLALATQLAFALPSIDFPVKHTEVPVYPGQYSFIVNGPAGVPNNVYFNIQCSVYNPNDYPMDIKFDRSSHDMCGDGAVDCTMLVNGKVKMMYYTIGTIQPGNNIIEVDGLKTTVPNSSVTFQDYDSNGSFFIESCKANLH